MVPRVNSSWRWLVSTRPWIIQIRSWGEITSRSLYDFAQHSATARHTLWKQCWKAHWLCTPPTRHVHLRSHKFGQQNHTTASLVRSCSNIPVITSHKHWYEVNGLVCHPNEMPLHTRTSRHMNFRAHTRNTRKSTDRITLSGFSNCPCNCIFTPSATRDGSSRSGNNNVCSLRSHSMSSQDILFLTPDCPALYTTTRPLFPVILPTSPTAGDLCKELKKTWQSVSDLQICCHFTLQHITVRPPSKQMIKQSHFWFVYLFSSHS